MNAAFGEGEGENGRSPAPASISCTGKNRNCRARELSFFVLLIGIWHSGETFHFCCPLKRMPSIDSIEIAVKDFSMKTLIKKLVAPGRTRINH